MDKGYKKSILRDKSVDFAVRIVELYKYLSNSRSEYILSKQLLRSATSIGANIFEAINAESTEDYVHKFSVSLKEANETRYWLTLLRKTDYLDEVLFKSLNRDIAELIAMLVSTIKTMKGRMKNSY